jgi:hypothetical protein
MKLAYILAAVGLSLAVFMLVGLLIISTHLAAIGA